MSNDVSNIGNTVHCCQCCLNRV